MEHKDNGGGGLSGLLSLHSDRKTLQATRAESTQSGEVHIHHVISGRRHVWYVHTIHISARLPLSRSNTDLAGTLGHRRPPLMWL